MGLRSARAARRRRDAALLRLLCRGIGFISSDEAHEALRAELTAPGLDWPRLLWLANSHFMATTLGTGLAGKGLADAPPAEVQRYLTDLCAANRERNAALRNEVERCLPALNAAGIEPVVLKGGAFLFDERFTSAASDRMMLDLDLLVPSEEVTPALRALAGIGWSPQREQYGLSHEAAPLVRSGAASPIEIHRALGPQRDLLAPARALSRARPLKTTSGTLRLLAPEDAWIHGLFHAEIQSFDHWFGSANLRGLHDLARIARTCPEELDWDRIRERFRSRRYERVLGAALAFLEQAFALPPPAAVVLASRDRRRAARRLERGLRPPRAKTDLLWLDRLGYLLLPRRVVFLFGLEEAPAAWRWLLIGIGQLRVLGRLATRPVRRTRRRRARAASDGSTD